ncbi:MAG: LPS assembly lipoprotein LptE [Candidatus Marinimicrobia bacterium]|nr:LPS assembly lipoprotein LptE [Candidatus Neomarinimicrobiota bacterium]
MIKKSHMIWWIFLSLLCIDCGYYSLAGSIPPHIRSISIPLLDNQTAEFGISEGITDNLLEKFTDENILRVVDVDNSDSILRGSIVQAEDIPYTYSKEEVVGEYRFTVAIYIEWIDVANDEVLFEKRFKGWGAYGIGGDISSDEIDNDGDGLIDDEDTDEIGDARTFATKVAVGKIAQDILNDILTTW